MKTRVKVLAAVIIGGFACVFSAFKATETTVNKEISIYTLLKSFGEEMPAHARENASAEQIEKGRDLVFKGRALGPNGKMSNYISKFYVCTSCHSPVREDPDLRIFDPEARLSYVSENKQKFLQGSPFYGIANRKTWYNDDYVLKYGDLVKPASKSLAEATQLCAKVCSSGRYLEDWELEAILAYYWSNQIKLKDLDLSAKEINLLEKGSESDYPDLIKMIKGKYALKSPATFGHNPKNYEKGYALEGRPEKGKLIYEFSCQTCHKESGVSGMTLEDSRLDFQKFKRNLTKDSDYNLYNIIRHGTYAEDGKPRYMPLFPEERMSNQQIEDLRSYILQRAG